MIGEPIDGEGAVYESNYDKRRVGKTVEKVANQTYQQFLAMGLRTVIKVTPQYALIGFRIADLAKAIQERSENKVIVQAKAKELGLWITILPNKNNNKQQ